MAAVTSRENAILHCILAGSHLRNLQNSLTTNSETVQYEKNGIRQKLNQGQSVKRKDQNLKHITWSSRWERDFEKHNTKCKPCNNCGSTFIVPEIPSRPLTPDILVPKSGLHPS